MLMHNLPQIAARRFGGVLERGELNSGPVLLRWTEFPEGVVFDPNQEGEYPEGISREATVTGLVYFVNQNVTSKEYAQIAENDAIVTFDAFNEPPFENMAALTLALPDGQEYVVSKTGTDAATRFYDLVLGGQRLSRTLAVRLK
jgi:hypothetical protein